MVNFQRWTELGSALVSATGRNVIGEQLTKQSMKNDQQSRPKRSNFADIARAAGVSVITVDRVLNERGSVSSATRTRVVEAARGLDVRRILPDTRHGLLHFDILMSNHQAPFQRRLSLAVDRAMQTLDQRISVHKVKVPLRDAIAYEKAILSPRYKRAGLMLIGAESRPVRDALCKVIDAGEAVSALVSDHSGLPPHHYAGIDNYSAGRTAGYWIGRLARNKGKVLVLYGIEGVQAHVDRVRGCLDALDEYFPTLEVQVSGETLDDSDRSFRFVNQALKLGPLAGIYDCGYSSTGVHAALHRHAAQGSTIWIGHEMLDDHRAYLKERSMEMVIDQNPDGQVQAALQYLFHACGLTDMAPSPEPVPFTLYTLPNMRKSGYMD